MAAAVNDVTGDKLQTGVSTPEFRSGYDLIWGNKNKEVKVEEQKSTVIIEEKAQERKLD